MTTYESDSSEGEAENFVTTNVVLGFASKEATDDEISQIGGSPSWLYSQPPAPHLTVCRACNERMALLLQLHADLPDQFPGHDRRLHIFGCRRKACRRKEGSVRVLRSTRVDPSAETSSTEPASTSENGQATATAAPPEPVPEKPKMNLGGAIFGGTGAGSANKNPFALGAGSAMASGGGPANPFSLGSPGSLASKPAQNPAASSTTQAPSNSSTSPAAANNLASTFAAKAKISSSSTSSSSSSFPIVSNKPAAPPKEPGPQQASYPSFFLDACHEELGEDPPDASAARGARVQLLDADEGTGAGTSGGSGGDKAGDFESAHDKTFQRFADRLWHNPEQVLRYEYEGLPLLYSRTDTVGRALSAEGSETGAGKVKTGGRSAAAAAAAAASGQRGIPSCASCAAPRTFECQITPHAIVELESEDADGGIDGMEWGTIIVGVCTRDCVERGLEKGKVAYLEEWAGVQWEESKK